MDENALECGEELDGSENLKNLLSGVLENHYGFSPESAFKCGLFPDGLASKGGVELTITETTIGLVIRIYLPLHDVREDGHFSHGNISGRQIMIGTEPLILKDDDYFQEVVDKIIEEVRYGETVMSYHGKNVYKDYLDPKKVEAERAIREISGEVRNGVILGAAAGLWANLLYHQNSAAGSLAVLLAGIGVGAAVGSVLGWKKYKESAKDGL
ncbi:hypothetical protein HZC20_01560 [Candidatus Peregrinibacteria bacterium]|nr:hypothetical protein [Candidatus Peregrinibacteria bacterium]